MPYSAADPVRVLIVEDSGTQAMFLDHAIRTILESDMRPAMLIRAERMQQAVELSRTTDFDLIFLDLTLPDSRATETIKRIPELAGRAAIVVLTDTAIPDITIEAHKNGADTVQSKHIVLDTHCFANVIANALLRRLYPPLYVSRK